MPLFRRRGTEGGEGEPKKKVSRKTLIGPAVLLRVQAAVTAADGAVTLPKAQDDGPRGSGYVRGLLDATPKKPQLEVLALRRSADLTTITVGVKTRNGATSTEFTTKGVLTEHNALTTGESIAKLLRQPASAALCGRQLLELTQAPEGAQKVFKLDTTGRLMIESGTE